MKHYKFKLLIDRMLIKVVDSFKRKTGSDVRRSYYGFDPLKN